jgi:hypothetical protein
LNELERRGRIAEANSNGNGYHVSARGVDPGRLVAAVQRDRLMLRYPRDARRQAVLEYVGRNYSEEGTSHPVFINLLALYVNIVTRSLVAKSPRAMLSTFRRENRPIASRLQSTFNRESEAMDLGETFRRWVTNHLFSMGVLKIALATPSDAAHLAWDLHAGEPFAQVVDDDDFVYDGHAKDWSEVSYIGHRCRVPLDTVVNSDLYNAKIRKTLVESYDPLFNQEGDERIDVISRTTYNVDTTSEYKPMVDLWEFYLPRERTIVTFPADSGGNPLGDILREHRWIGPDCGPYHMLGAQVVPGNIRFKAPIHDLYDQHCLVNNIYRKLARQSERCKQLNTWAGSSEEDADRLMNADDGSWPRVDNPDRIKPIVMDGPNQNLLLMLKEAIQQFSTQAGNMEMLGGLAPQSRTATQDKLLNANASGTMMAMQENVSSAIAKACKAICWYIHNDPFKTYKTTFSLPGMPSLSVPQVTTPEMRRRVPWDELDIRVDPYSYQLQTPQGRLMQLQQALKDLIPLMPLLAQQGIKPDMNFYLKRVGELTDNPDLQEMFTIMDAPQPQPGQGGGTGAGSMGEEPTMAPQTERTYTRISEPGRTQRGDNMMMGNFLRGQNPGGNPQQTGGGQ